MIEVVLTLVQDGEKVVRRLLADTGAGAIHDSTDLVLDEVDCLLCGGKPSKMVKLGGAYSGVYPIYAIPIEIPQINFKRSLSVVGVADTPKGFDGIACFTYGNFGSPAGLSWRHEPAQ